MALWVFGVDVTTAVEANIKGGHTERVGCILTLRRDTGEWAQLHISIISGLRLPFSVVFPPSLVPIGGVKKYDSPILIVFVDPYN